jgi:hypothetical protein
VICQACGEPLEAQHTTPLEAQHTTPLTAGP